MFMKHYAPSRCEPRIIVKMGFRQMGGGGEWSGRGDMNEEFGFVKVQKTFGGGGGQGGCERRIVNEKLKLL